MLLHNKQQQKPIGNSALTFAHSLSLLSIPYTYDTFFPTWLISLSYRWREQIPLKQYDLSTELHGITSHQNLKFHQV